MSFSSFDNINEKFNKLLTDYFNFGNIKFKFLTKDKLNMEIGANHACKSHNSNLDVQSKLKYKNIELITKFLSTNMLTLECQVEDFPLRDSGARFSINNDFSIKYHNALAQFYKSGTNYHVGTDLRFIRSMTQPLTTVHSLFGYEGYFLGGKLCLDSHGKQELQPDVDLCMGYSVDHFSFHGSIAHRRATAAALYQASIYQRINDNVQCGINIGWEMSSNNVNVGLVAHIDLDEQKKAFVKFKTHNCQSLGLAYGFEFMRGVHIALNGEFSKACVNFGINTCIEMD